MTDKSDYKVFDVPFSTSITGTIKVLATDAKTAREFCENKLENGSLGIDRDNLCEEGIMHDGSISFGLIEPIAMDFGQPTESSDDPKAHGDWDAIGLEDEEEENQ